MDTKNETELFKRFEDLYNNRCNVNKRYPEDLINECFYHLNCYYKLHLNQQCPSNYFDDDNCGNFILSNEAILLLRLHQNLLSDDFFCLLENVFAITREQYINFQVNSEVLYNYGCIRKIYLWLLERNDPFAEKVLTLLDGLDDSSIQERICRTQGILKSQGILKEQGICLIINNEEFLGNLTRYGTAVDEKNITDTFTKMNFNVVAHRDVSKDDLLKILELTKSDIKSEHRMFIAFFLSHGRKGTLITRDRKEIKFKDLWYPFRSSKCKIIKKKAKLFFFVCCQGNDYNQAISNDGIQVDSPTLEFDSIPDNSKDPDVGNFFFGYATYKTFRSFRQTSNGTFYIRNLCETIRKYPSKSISEIHEMIQGLITNEEIPGKNCFQMPYCENLLREPCVFVYDELKRILSEYGLLQ